MTDCFLVDLVQSTPSKLTLVFDGIVQIGVLTCAYTPCFILIQFQLWPIDVAVNLPLSPVKARDTEDGSVICVSDYSESTGVGVWEGTALATLPVH